jgi:AcrR family transcriptional regulator
VRSNPCVLDDVGLVPEARPKQERGVRSAERILDSAAALIARNGFAGTSISALVKECGVPASSIYYFFGSKEGVLAAVMERSARQFFETIPVWEDAKGRDSSQRLAHYFGELAGYIGSRPEFHRILVLLVLERGYEDEHVRTVAQRVRATAIDQLEVPMLELLQEMGVPQPRRRAREMAFIALAAIDGVMVALHTGEPVDPPKLFKQIHAMLVAHARAMAAG